MSKEFITYDLLSGEVLSLGVSPWPEHHVLRDGEGMLVCGHVDVKLHRVSSERRIVRKATAAINADEIDEAWRLVRNQRDYLLSVSDKTQMSDCPLSPRARKEWVAYRRELRDFPKKIQHMIVNRKAVDDLNWPIKPSEGYL